MKTVTMRDWPARRWVAAFLGAMVAALVVAIPTGIIHTAFYVRMTPVLWWNYPVWIATAVLSGLILATYVSTELASSVSSRVGVSANALSLLAVGCPICNKLVVMAIGVSGALDLWAPVQPVIGIVSVGVMVWALRLRIQGERACPTPRVGKQLGDSAGFGSAGAAKL
ncbi:hypothetical protein [Rhodococcus sp. EPR-157]|jgi:hypothetical protein|uniref:hypothetical protein n=1 Tax=Rhodococcus sp. EPR-157 TaxID=1813677 RepID=UPI000B155C8C|nr:hypothetical protein [Rhodococcus sp. EPR-157]